MKGGRQRFVCAKCGRPFTYWVVEGSEHPKVKCSFCHTESFPRGEPPAAPAPPAPAKEPGGTPKGG